MVIDASPGTSQLASWVGSAGQASAAAAGRTSTAAASERGAPPRRRATAASAPRARRATTVDAAAETKSHSQIIAKLITLTFSSP